MSAAECASEACGAEQANELAVQVNEETDERVAQNLHLDSCFFLTIVHIRPKVLKMSKKDRCQAQCGTKLDQFETCNYQGGLYDLLAIGSQFLLWKYVCVKYK